MALAQDWKEGRLKQADSPPLSEFGFYLHKCAFRDALCLRYGWRIPINYECGIYQVFSRTRFILRQGWVPIVACDKRLNSYHKSACNNICTETTTLSGEHLPGITVEGAHLDVAANMAIMGWRFECT